MAPAPPPMPQRAPIVGPPTPPGSGHKRRIAWRRPQVEDPIQTNARGAAFIASVGLGYMTFEDIPKYIQINNTFEPNPENRETYDRLFAEFLNIYKHNKAIFKRLNSTD